jgi:hypothetical protein
LNCCGLDGDVEVCVVRSVCNNACGELTLEETAGCNEGEGCVKEGCGEGEDVDWG